MIWEDSILKICFAKIDMKSTMEIKEQLLGGFLVM